MTWLRENWIAIAALVVSIVSLTQSCRQESLARRVAGVHLEPVVVARFDAPKNENPVFVVSNEGPANVASLSASGRMFVYDKTQKTIVSAATLGKLFSPGALFRQELKPSEHASLELMGVRRDVPTVILYEIALRYYRPTDMKEYERRERYFIDGGVLKSHQEFRRSNDYRRLMDGAESMPIQEPKWDPGALKKFIESSENSENLPPHNQPMRSDDS